MSKAKKTDRPVLSVETRKILGRKVKTLRSQGLLPANVYGRKIKSLSVQGDFNQIKKTFNQVGETGLVNLKIDKEKSFRPILLHNPQLDPVTDKLIHLDFYQVDLTQKVTADIPVEISGEAPAAQKDEGVLVQLVNEIEIEALPSDLPEKLVVNVASLEKIDDAITVSQAVKKLGWATNKIEIKAALEQLLVKIEAPTKKEEKPVELAEETEIEGKEVKEGEEAKKEGEGKAKPEEGKKSEPAQKKEKAKS